MSSFTFEATSVVTEQPDGEYHLVGFADQKLNTRLYLMLQRAMEHDDQDASAGMDTFYVEWCGQDQSGYGGIARFVLRPDGVDVTFEPESVAELGGMENLSIAFRLNHVEFSALRNALGHIFAGSDCLVVSDV